MGEVYFEVGFELTIITSVLLTYLLIIASVKPCHSLISPPKVLHRALR